MNFKTNTRGFTLIELLVVIAIIGILASVVLASLNTAREKGANAAIRSSLNNARPQASLYYDNSGMLYEIADGSDSVCVNDATATVIGISEHIQSADTTNGLGIVDCNDDPEAWALAAQLVGADSGSYYCTDSTGFAGDLVGVVGGTDNAGGDFTDSDLVCQ